MTSNRHQLSSANRIAAASGSKPVGRGVYIDQLGPQDRADLDAFSTWFGTLTTTKVVASYRTYLAKAWTCDDVSKLTSSQQSAQKKFDEFERLCYANLISWLAS